MARPRRLSREALSAYRRRPPALRALGFFDYQAYLESYLWGTIPLRVLTTAGRRCCACDEEGCTQVHHESYSLAVLAGEDDSKLSVVCDPCHDRAHHFGGLLLGPGEATANLRKARDQKGLDCGVGRV